MRAALNREDLGTIDNWLRNIRDIARLHKDELYSIEDEEERLCRLVELNVMEQVWTAGLAGARVACRAEL